MQNWTGTTTDVAVADAAAEATTAPELLQLLIAFRYVRIVPCFFRLYFFMSHIYGLPEFVLELIF